MPLFHVHGLIGVTLASLAAGGTVVMPARLRMRTFWEAVAEHDVSWVSAVPTLLAGIPAGPRSWHRLRFLRSASSPLPPTLAARLEDDLGVPVLEAYGMTEATHQMASNPLPPAERRPGSVGTATNIETGRGRQVLDPGGAWRTGGSSGPRCVHHLGVPR